MVGWFVIVGAACAADVVGASPLPGHAALGGLSRVREAAQAGVEGVSGVVDSGGWQRGRAEQARVASVVGVAGVVANSVGTLSPLVGGLY